MNQDRKTLNEDLGNSVVPFPLPEGKRWADYMWELTPVEQKSNGMWFKREDLFSLLGINSLNGSKCRQLLHLFETRPKGADTVIHATNVNASPQTPMTAAMAEHYHLRCIQVAGGTNLEAINKHQLPLFATMFGTEYEIETGSGFNVNIQKRVADIMETFDHSFTIERDITINHKLAKNTPKMIKDFHAVGAHQTKNIPTFVTDLIIPFGSANSATSILFGLSNDRELLPKELKRIHLVNVGVDKREYMFDRLKMMDADISDYEIVWHESGYPYSKTIKDIRIDDITFHYRYEAKVYKHIKENHPELINDKTLFWVIGSVPDLATTAKNINREIPTTVKTFEFEKEIPVDMNDLVNIKDDENVDEWFGEPEENIKDPILEELVVENPDGGTLYYLKSGNAGGKSTIPVLMMDADPLVYKVKSLKYNKVIFTVFPNANMVSLGNYDSGKTFGGCDGLVKEEILYALEVLKDEEWLQYDIYFEGSMPSDTIATYFNMMKKLTNRKMVVLFLSTTYAQGLDRIQARTGKSDEEMAKLKNVESKYKRVDKAKIIYREEISKEKLDIELLELNTDQPIRDVFEDFVHKEFANITQGDVCHA